MIEVGSTVNTAFTLINVAQASYFATDSALDGDYTEALKELIISVALNKLAKTAKNLTLSRAFRVREFESIIKN